MFRQVFLICAIFSFFALVHNVCIEPPKEEYEGPGGPVNPMICVKSENYTNDVKKLKKPGDEMTLAFALSDIPVLVNNGFEPLAGIIVDLIVAKSGLKTIEDDAFAGLTKLTRLYLGDNQLTEVKASWFRNTPQLQTLLLNRNRITHFDPNIFQTLPDLKELDVAKNRIRCLDIEHLEKLKGPKIEVDKNPYDWICAVPIMKWSIKNNKEMLFYENVRNVAFECWDKITDGPNKEKMLDDCITAKLEEALTNPALLKLNETETQID